MIDGLKDDGIIERLGGRFKLTALIQRRLVELMQGARPMVDTRGLTDIEVVVQEILDGKIEPEVPEVHEEFEEADDELAV
jgi:DNA-directed RNA polymerase subunit omega